MPRVTGRIASGRRRRRRRHRDGVSRSYSFDCGRRDALATSDSLTETIRIRVILLNK